LVQPFADPEIGAVSGNAKVANRSGLIPRWQHIEYVVGFNIDRRVYDMWRCIPTVPGAVGAFRRRALLDVGGVSADTLAEDTDLTMAVIRAGWRIVFEEKARAWTEAPTTLAELWRQRYRWSGGTMQSMWLLAPLIDVFLVYGLLFRDPVPTLAAWAGVTVLQLVAGVFAFRLERERLRPLWLLPLQQIVYRQLMYAVLLQSAVTAFAGVRLRWQKLRHRGDFASAPVVTTH
jgi:cellulose synthase/poly-beta-1,6-N-acetylglucosamine synthase-like glycosyltransferase